MPLGNCRSNFRTDMLCGAVGGGACDRQWAGGGSVQELNWEAIEADVGRVESRET